MHNLPFLPYQSMQNLPKRKLARATRVESRLDRAHIRSKITLVIVLIGRLWRDDDEDDNNMRRLPLEEETGWDSG